MTLTKTKPGSPAGDSAGFAAARRSMIDSQLRTSGVNDEFVLARMLDVPREKHVPASALGTAYIDRSIPLENGRRIAAPLFYGMVLTEARPTAEDSVLVVDAGSGYLPALVKPIVASVDVIDPQEAAAKTSKRKTYSLILVDGAAEAIPATLVKRLAANGRIVTGIATKGVTKLAIGQKTGSDLALLPLAETGIPRLAEFDAPKGWSF
ncbi:protein-L-isoaspartate O-methyltransferase [Altererythrobacter aquaemixtae]|uniref:Protein-L-isoaspartate O-methyltransferase n=2 Tax=Pontixanthobacter aquaemixtae TaxID=1958940 RepID=A0A845A1B0_9SPHN|nr:protein-L-isoaspartate O-methyltransferase [Pontixanthobacter aquaemixtae]